MSKIKWKLSGCDTHNEIELWREVPILPGHKEKNIQRVKLESDTGDADARSLGLLIQATLNGENDTNKLVEKVKDYENRLNNIISFANGRWP